MSDRLDTYREKRDPARTPEPFGARRAARRKEPALSFVVQKHAARRLHWDFRLELGGTLRSWAVPKGPSADPADRRLAVQVEDHPLEYAGFEGIIPAGNYGAGAVIVWDRGTWAPQGDAEAGLRAGKLVFRLDGEKLRGEWTLVRTRREEGGKTDWLLMKHRGDAYAGAGRPFAEASVLTGRTLEEVAREGAPRERARAPVARARRARREPVEVTDPEKVLFPEDGVTRGELASYYRKIARLMLPYLADRPVVVTRYPDGIRGRGFVQRDAPEWLPPWLRTAMAPGDPRGPDLPHLLIDDADGLAWLANQAVVPVHVLAARAGSVDRPDWCAVTAEPVGAGLDEVIRLVRALRSLCEQIGLPAFPRTTGLGGLQVLVPLGGQLTHAQARTLGELLVRAVEGSPPEGSGGRDGGARARRVRLDPAQNGRGRTVIAPYAVAPRPGAPVSTPLRWSEVTSRLDPSRFTLREVPRRAARLKADPLRPVLTRKPDVAAALERLRDVLRRSQAGSAPAPRTRGATHG